MKKIFAVLIALSLVLVLLPVGAVGDSHGNMDDVEANIGFIPNSGEASVSRVDLESFEEIARYWTAEDSPTDVWRTSRIAQDADGNAYVLNVGSDALELTGSVVRIQADTEGLTTTDSATPLPFGDDEAVQVFPVGGEEEMPRAIAIDDDGYIWVGYYGSGRLVQYAYDPGDPEADPVVDPSLELVDDWTKAGIGFYEMKFAPDGTLFISSRQSTSTPARTGIATGIYTFDGSEFDQETTWNPYSILIAEDGTVYATAYSDELWIRDTDGVWSNVTITGSSQNRGMAFDNDGKIWIASTTFSGGIFGGTTIYSYNPDGGAVGPNYTLDEGTVPVGVGKDAAGNMWAVCRSDALDQGFIEGFDPSDQTKVGAIQVGYRPYAYGDFVVEPQTGCLSVEKIWVGYDDVIGFDEDTMIPDSIDILIEGPSYGYRTAEEPDGGLEVTLSATDDPAWYFEDCGLEPGDYTVTELTEYDEWDISVSPISVNVGAGGAPAEALVTITNTYQPGCLEINKAWITTEETGEYITVDLPESISVLIEGPSYPDGKEVTLEPEEWSWESCYVLIPGEYTVTEQGVEDAWFVNYKVNGDVYVETGEVNLEPGETAEVTIQNYYLFMDDTFWAYAGTEDDGGAEIDGLVMWNSNVDDNPSNAWGWTNFIDEAGTYTWDLWASAGQNILDNGYKVGTLTVEVEPVLVDPETDEIESFTATVTYAVDEGYEAVEYHLWVGDTPLPEVERGRRTVSTAAPGQFPYGDGAVVEGLSPGGFYVAAHGVARMAYEPVMLESVVYDGEGDTFGSHVGDTMTFEFSGDIYHDPLIEVKFETAQRLWEGWGEDTTTWSISDNVLTVEITATWKNPRDVVGDKVISITGLVDAFGYPVFVPDEGVDIET